ncbi:MAG: 30S ribosomal protein S13 [Promethearchaeota archaeon]
MSEKSYVKNIEFRNLIRMIGTSIEGSRLVENGLTMIKGVGRRFAQAVVRVAKIDPNTRIGMLSEDQIELLENIIKDPIKYGIPHWMVNRQRDLVTGEDRHLSGTQVDLILKLDIDRMKRTKSWKGVRHHLGLKVRGQRTRCTGRKGLTVGYYRKKKKKG